MTYMQFVIDYENATLLFEHYKDNAFTLEIISQNTLSKDETAFLVINFIDKFKNGQILHFPKTEEIDILNYSFLTDTKIVIEYARTRSSQT